MDKLELLTTNLIENLEYLQREIKNYNYHKEEISLIRFEMKIIRGILDQIYILKKVDEEN